MTSIPAHIIKQAPVFASLTDDEAERLGHALRDDLVPAGEVLFLEGQPGDRFYIVLNGRVEILKALGTEEERRLSLRVTGEYFGEMSLLDPDGLRTATARTLDNVWLLSLSRGDFHTLLQNHPSLAYEMVRVLTLQLRDSNDATISDLRRKNKDLSAAYAELKTAQAQIIEKEKLEQELRTAQRIQESILPGQLPVFPGYDFGATMMPARTVGGDLYDFIPLGPGRIGIAVGDVSDKGIPAAIFMALTRSLLRAEATRSLTRPPSPQVVLQRVNRLLLDMNDAGMFVTLLYGILDGRRRTFAYARAGHELPLVLRAANASRGGARASAECTAELAAQGKGVPLGLFDDAVLDEQVIHLARHDTLLLYTDGATDITDAGDVLYGMERLQETACAAAGCNNAQSCCDKIWRDLNAYRGSSIQADDVALVAVSAR